MAKQKIAKCPICGKKGKFDIKLTFDGDYYFVICDSPAKKGYAGHYLAGDDCPTKEEAVVAWNAMCEQVRLHPQYF